MTENKKCAVGPDDDENPWIENADHRTWLLNEAHAQFRFFRKCLRQEPGFHVLDIGGRPIPDAPQELHSTARMVHSFALGKSVVFPGAESVLDHGMTALWEHHLDPTHGGFVWSFDHEGPLNGEKLLYGHVFALLAGASAKIAGHSDADRVIEEAATTLEEKYWDKANGLFKEEFARDWSSISNYRGMNGNMHAVEALLTAYEATDDSEYLSRAGRILEFFTGEIGPQYNWRLPEHYSADWTIDPDYEGNPMFRPAGTTPGHSFEFARLILQYWDLSNRPEDDSAMRARWLFERALADAKDELHGGFVYTVGFDGKWLRKDRFWWPVTEAIGATASFLKLDWEQEFELLYRELWTFAVDHLIDHKNGGWFPELNNENRPISTQFAGKPDIYHSIQACLYPLAGGLSRPRLFE